MTDEEFEKLAEPHIGWPPGSRVYRLMEEARRARGADGKSTRLCMRMAGVILFAVVAWLMATEGLL